ncbi:hypothetical protein HFZ77_01255 [Thalassovita gelatinovora]|nr:hypothetical protein [Thalassovita gelatinovora]QIZ79194.1 hypothetical protein HFZ77_01255 [Thalassovita gelatinovora]
MTAILSPLVMGGLGLGVETGHWYQKQRQLQHISDLASNSAAVRLRAGDDDNALYTTALTIASGSGFEQQIGNIEVHSPPISGEYTGNSSAVEVILTETRPRWFSAIFMQGDVNLTARSVSLIDGGNPACILALSETASGAITVTGSTNVNLTNCVVTSNSTSSDAFSMHNSASHMTTDCVHTVGGATYTSNLTLNDCSAPKTMQAKTRDPYADRTEPVSWGSCSSGRIGRPNRSTTVSATTTHPNGMQSKRFCDGLTLKGNVTFEPGLYIIDGGTFSVNSQSVISNQSGGVTFFLTNGADVKFNGGSTIEMDAPTSGPTSGMLFWESKYSSSSGHSGCGGGSSGSVGTSHKFNGGSSVSLQGAIYLPVSEVTFNGNSNAQNGCTQVIADTIKFSGNSDLSVTCENTGTEQIMAGESASVVE